MRGAEGPRDRGRDGAAGAGSRDPDHLQGLALLQRRHQRRQPPRRQGLADPRRPGQQQAVPAGRRDLQGAPQVRLPLEVGQVGRLGIGRGGQRRAIGLRDRLQVTVRERGKAGHVIERHHLQPLDQRRLGGVARRHGDPPQALRARALGHRQRTRHGSDRAVEGELPRKRVALHHASSDLVGGGQQGGGDRQVEARPGLAQHRRSQVRGDSLQRELEARVQQGRAHALARLPDRGVREPDDREAGQARCHVQLDVHGLGLDRDEGEGSGHREHVGEARRAPRAPGAPIAPDSCRFRSDPRNPGAIGMRSLAP